MREKALQIFTDEYLEQARLWTPRQIVDFLEDFRHVAAAGQPQKSRLISMRVSEHLLRSFKARAKLIGKPYQTMIQDLMRESLVAKRGVTTA
jgi:predicted DNA binding CopG/RHH family protein